MTADQVGANGSIRLTAADIVELALAKRQAAPRTRCYNHNRSRVRPTGSDASIEGRELLPTSTNRRSVLMKRGHMALFLALAAITASLAGCEATPAPASYTDPFDYCVAWYTIDAPDAAYTGSQVPESVVQGLQTALNIRHKIGPNSAARCSSSNSRPVRDDNQRRPNPS